MDEVYSNLIHWKRQGAEAHGAVEHGEVHRDLSELPRRFLFRLHDLALLVHNHLSLEPGHYKALPSHILYSTHNCPPARLVLPPLIAPVSKAENGYRQTHVALDAASPPGEDNSSKKEGGPANHCMRIYCRYLCSLLMRRGKFVQKTQTTAFLGMREDS